MSAPRPPVKLDRVLHDPSLIRELTEANAPYQPVQRYFASLQEQQALGGPEAGKGPPAGQEMFVAPLFRGDWAYDRPVVDGVEPLLHNKRFIDAAQRLFDASVVRPQIVYINLSVPMPLYDGGHTDIPAFRGIDRTRYPVWLLAIMGRSGLFERWRVRIATAVSWWYQGEGGEFTYWPEGPDAAPTKIRSETNTAVVGDNDFMFHRVERVGPPDVEWVRGLTLDSVLEQASDGDWVVREGDRELARLPYEAIRISVSWKAQVFSDADEAELVDQGREDISLDDVWRILGSDLETGVRVDLPDDPLHDRDLIATLTQTYHRAPTVYPPQPTT